MRRLKIRISAGGVLLLAALYFCLDARELAALLLAAAAHELGHIAALRLCGARLGGLSADLAGPLLTARGALGRGRECICLAAGPAAGLLYAFAAACAGGALLSLSAGLSLALSAFNLLPARPLDGGRILEALLGEGPAAACGLAVSAALLAAGTALLCAGRGAGLLIAGALLLVKNL